MRSPRLILALCLMTGLAACHRGESADNSPPPTNKQLIENGDADAVMLARAMLRNPHWALVASEALGVHAPWPDQVVRARTVRW